MAARTKCPNCGKRVAITKAGVIKGHGAGAFPRDFAGGMSCSGSGKREVAK
jgi:hypothetical protein